MVSNTVEVRSENRNYGYLVIIVLLKFNPAVSVKATGFYRDSRTDRQATGFSVSGHFH
jgi:hypothetical protein